MPSTDAFATPVGPVDAAPDAPSMGGGGGPPDQFYKPPEWRWLVTDLSTVGITYLERVAYVQRVTNLLEGARRAELTVPSNSPLVNIPYTDAGDGGPFPYVHEGVRLLFGWRGELSVDDPDFPADSPITYVLRFGGIVLQCADNAQTEIGETLITAFDPRQFLYLIPVLGVNAVGHAVQPTGTGVTFSGFTGDEIVRALIERAQEFYAHELFLAEGIVESTVEVPKIKFARGTSVGEAIDKLQAAGYLDFISLPLWDPTGFPGVCATWNVYSQAGAIRPNAVFAWDQAPRSLVGVSSLLDGAQRANIVQFGRGAGGRFVTTQQDVDSITRFGPYVAQQFFPGNTKTAALIALAQQQLSLRAQGRQTIDMVPMPSRSPVPYNDFDLGDRVPIRWSDRLRWARSGQSRVYGFTLEMLADVPEKISAMILSPRGFAE